MFKLGDRLIREGVYAVAFLGLRFSMVVHFGIRRIPRYMSVSVDERVRQL